MERIGVIAIVVEGDRSISLEIQQIVNQFSGIILGRMGIPHHEANISTISLIVKGANEQINALTGRLGRLPNVTVKAAITNYEIKQS